MGGTSVSGTLEERVGTGEHDGLDWAGRVEKSWWSWISWHIFDAPSSPLTPWTLSLSDAILSWIHQAGEAWKSVLSASCLQSELLLKQPRTRATYLCSGKEPFKFHLLSTCTGAAFGKLSLCPFSPSELWVCPLLQQIAILPVEAATRVGHAHGHSLCEGRHFLFPLWLMTRWADMLLPWRYHIYSPSTFPLPTVVLPKLERACIRKAR